MTITNEIIQFISEYYGIETEEIRPDSNLVADLGLQSFSVIEMCCELEEQYHIEIPEEELSNIVTVADLADYVALKSGELQNAG